MELKLAKAGDLNPIKEMFQKIMEKMEEENIHIWDEIYPCEFFCEDIEKRRLYILKDGEKIVSAFALCDSEDGESHIDWKKPCGRALYIERLRVNVDYLRRGIGGITLNKAVLTAREKGAESLRLFVAAVNKPAINLYIKSGFKMADGIYEKKIDENYTLREYGFEIETGL